jgi:hypothetical protein
MIEETDTIDLDEIALSTRRLSPVKSLAVPSLSKTQSA